MHSYLFSTLLKFASYRVDFFCTAQAEGDKSTNGVGMHKGLTFPSEYLRNIWQMFNCLL